jgi:hypothetical protein
VCSNKEAVMKRILLAVSALAIAGAASLISANAQGVGVQVGPFRCGRGRRPLLGWRLPSSTSARLRVCG